MATLAQPQAAHATEEVREVTEQAEGEAEVGVRRIMLVHFYGASIVHPVLWLHSILNLNSFHCYIVASHLPELITLGGAWNCRERYPEAQ